MTWNIAPEFISVIILCIIWVYSRRGNPLPTLRNKLFQVCFLTTFCSITSNIISTFMIYDLAQVPITLAWLANTVYFVSTPLMGIVYFYYSAAVQGRRFKENRLFVFLTALPVLLYLLVVITNPFTELLFVISRDVGYVRGPLIILTYIVFYIYCFLCVLLVRFRHSQISLAEKRILTVFPLLAFVVIFIQQYLPGYVLTGSAATCALLIIYLYLENKQISMDYLTGLPNRHIFLGMMKLKIEQKKSEGFIVVVFSLQQFKSINNKYGQYGGDDLLQQVAQFLKTTVAPHILYRFSGDEFAILVEDAYLHTVEPFVLQIQERMALPWGVGLNSCVLAYGIGLVRYQEAFNSVEAIINGIEFAVGQTKNDSLENCIYCTPEMLSQVDRQNQILEILKESLDKDRFELYFQPILDVDAKRFLIAESLLRLNNTKLGNLSPAEFIPLAEKSGLIIKMTYQILDKACKFVKMLLDEGKEISGVTVNFSAVQFEDKDFQTKFIKIIQANDIPYSCIKIEITEGVLIDNFNEVERFVMHLHKLGIQFGLDDFGTGYSNLSIVLKLPWDTIKLDKSLVDAAMINPKSALLVRHIVSAFRDLGLHVLAEGVENEAQRDFIIDVGCHMIQGYLYAKPMPGKDALRLMGTDILPTPTLSAARQG